MPSMDVFKGNGFDTISMTDEINSLPFVPGQVSASGLFEESGVSNSTVQIERKDGVLRLLPTKQRGSPATRHTPSQRNLRDFRIPHIPYEDVVTAEEVQNIRAFGEESEVETVMGKVNERMAEMTPSMDATIEHHRVGALRGIVLDADGTELHNLYTEFGISAPPAFDFGLDDSATKVRNKCSEAVRAVSSAMKGTPVPRVQAYCGKIFFDSLVGHDDVEAAWERWQNGEQLRQQTAYRSLFFGGILFQEYRDDAGVDEGDGTLRRFIDDEEAVVYPAGVRGLYRTIFGPADFNDTVNTMGLPRYARLAVDPEFQRYTKIHMQTNPLTLTTRPEGLLPAVSGN